MRKLMSALTVAGSILAAAPALAADAAVGNYEVGSRSWYAEIRAGAPIPVDHGFNSPATGPGQYKPSSGFHVGVDVGKYITDNWRAELGLYWNRGSKGSARLGGGAPIPHSGSVNTYTFMGNLLYAFHTGSPLRPYVGAGLGFTHFDFNGLGATGGAFTITGSKTVMTAALHTGLDYKLSERTTLTSRYTLGWVDGGGYATTIPGLTVTTSSEVEHILGVGIRFDLN